MISVQNYASFFENIDKDTPIEDYQLFFDKNAMFKDPFHEVKGVERIYDIFQKMYLDLDNPIFKVEEIVENKNISYIKWQFNFYFKNEKEKNSFTGVSRVIFNHDGKAIVHEDYWDAAENIYEKIAFVKHLIKIVKNRIRA